MCDAVVYCYSVWHHGSCWEDMQGTWEGWIYKEEETALLHVTTDKYHMLVYFWMGKLTQQHYHDTPQ